MPAPIRKFVFDPRDEHMKRQMKNFSINLQSTNKGSDSNESIKSMT
jgi:hypothetical protein